MTLDELIDLLFIKYGSIEVIDRIRAYFANQEQTKELEELMILVLKKVKEQKPVTNPSDPIFYSLHDQYVLPKQNGHHKDYQDSQVSQK
jgi:hypothetical protein